MEKSEYQRATENERAAIREMLKGRDRKLVRFTLERLEEVGALVTNPWAEEVEEVTLAAVEEICEQFWDTELDV